MKIYEKYKLIDLQVKQNLVREIKVLHKLNHPNILKLFESIDTLNNVYLVTEYVQGVSLHEYVKSRVGNKASEEVSIKVIKQILEALAYLH